MITSNRQLALANKQLAALCKRLASPAKKGVPEHILAMETSQVKDEISRLEQEIDVYDRACNADLNNLNFDSYDEFLRLPIVIRLAKGITLSGFADELQVSLRQLKRYEEDEYRNAPAEVVREVLAHFQLQVAVQIVKAS